MWRTDVNDEDNILLSVSANYIFDICLTNWVFSVHIFCQQHKQMIILYAIKITHKNLFFVCFDQLVIQQTCQTLDLPSRNEIRQLMVEKYLSPSSLHSILLKGLAQTMLSNEPASVAQISVVGFSSHTLDTFVEYFGFLLPLSSQHCSILFVSSTIVAV